ncbi:MAG: hypothetical protein ACO34J_07470 [Prochlorothrix sp.]
MAIEEGHAEGRSGRSIVGKLRQFIGDRCANNSPPTIAIFITPTSSNH